jgi:hypothetical protein
MARQERLKRCKECGRKNISPFWKGNVCGPCIAEIQIEEIRNGGTAKEVVLCEDSSGRNTT